MKRGFYLRLAWTGIRKNRRLYTPYLLTCIGMVMMFYIITALSESNALLHMRGGDTMCWMLQFGSWVIALFSALFLFYSNSFLIRRRKKEFGLYNILGMGKGNIGCILFWETLICAALALGLGLFAGIVLFKLAELLLVNIMQGDVTYTLSISLHSVTLTIPVFAAIFGLILLNALRQVHATNAIALLHSESIGEKPPKANWIFGLLGVVLLAGAYDLAVSIQEPLSAMVWFFVAVCMVILATYLLFIAGSVVLCRILQKNRKYYYKANHFVSVSSMAYRMKRNGAGLASICILATMVLVMMCSTTCLYFGSEDALRTRYPRDITIETVLESLEDMGNDELQQMREDIDGILARHQIEPDNIWDYCISSVSGMLKNGVLETDSRTIESAGTDMYANVRTVYFVPEEDCSRMLGRELALEPGEVMVYPVRCALDSDTLTVASVTFRVKGTLDDFPISGDAAMDVVPSLFVIVPDMKTTMAPLLTLRDHYDNRLFGLKWNYGFDTSVDEKTQIAAYEEILDLVIDLRSSHDRGFERCYVECRANERGDFYATFGGLFFLGLALSVVFLFAAVLIIYYKQVSEGYEDQARFEIMQKVGMTRSMIRSSINSQLLTVFFLPLVTAGLHLAFAFPMLHKLLMLFNMRNIQLLMLTTLISYLVFALLYLLVYRITSNAYYDIVSGAKDEAV